MGITTSGFYTLGNNVGQCLENNQGNKVRVAKCDDLNPKEYMALRCWKANRLQSCITK